MFPVPGRTEVIGTAESSVDATSTAANSSPTAQPDLPLPSPSNFPSSANTASPRSLEPLTLANPRICEAVAAVAVAADAERWASALCAANGLDRAELAFRYRQSFERSYAELEAALAAGRLQELLGTDVPITPVASSRAATGPSIPHSPSCHGRAAKGANTLMLAC
jgi:hypothetical protein